MKQVMRVVVALVALFNAALAFGFLLLPARLGATFFLTADGIQGLATMRADFTAFFLTGAIFALAGAWRAQSRPLLVPLLLLGIALSGRVVGVIVDGWIATMLPPMAVEAAMIAILALAYRSFDRARR